MGGQALTVAQYCSELQTRPLPNSAKIIPKGPDDSSGTNVKWLGLSDSGCRKGTRDPLCLELFEEQVGRKYTIHRICVLLSNTYG